MICTRGGVEIIIKKVSLVAQCARESVGVNRRMRL